MGQNETRLWSTVAIWIAVAAIGVAAMVTHIDVDGGALVVLFIGLMIGGAAATSTIWKGAEESHHGVGNSEKMKRHSKIERLMNRLDEHELEELRTRLMSEQDGEAVSLDELLAERERQIR